MRELRGWLKGMGMLLWALGWILYCTFGRIPRFRRWFEDRGY